MVGRGGVPRRHHGRRRGALPDAVVRAATRPLALVLLAGTALLACAAGPTTSAPASAPVAPATAAGTAPPGSARSGASGGTSIAPAPPPVSTTRPAGPPRPLGEGAGRVVEYAWLGAPSYDIGALAVDPGGRLWFGAGTVSQTCLVAVDPPSGARTAMAEPIAGVATAPDGSVWSTADRAAVRRAPGGDVQRVDVGATVGSEHVVHPITVDPSNRAWLSLTDTDALARVDADGSVRTFRDEIPSGAGPGTIAAAADGTIWFTEPDAHLIGHAAADGTITQIDVGGAPEVVVAAPDGGAWFFDGAARGFGRIAGDGSVRRVTDAQPSAPVVDMTVAPDGSVWYVADPGVTGRFGDGLPLQELATVDASGTTVGAQFHHPRAVAAAPDGTIWFTDRFYGGEGSSIALYAVLTVDAPPDWPPGLPLQRPIGSTISTCADS